MLFRQMETIHHRPLGLIEQITAAPEEGLWRHCRLKVWVAASLRLKLDNLIFFERVKLRKEEIITSEITSD